MRTTHRASQEQGPNVVGGQLVWTSATGITAADTGSYGGCLRRWYIEQVQGEKGPPTAAMMGGTDLHTEIETRLRTGAPLQTPLALSGAHFVPQPGGNLQIERPIHFKTKSGVSIYGHVDLYNFRQEYIDEEGVLQRDPSWSFEVKDWKTTAGFQYAKTAAELAQNIQLVTYAEAGFRFAPDMERSRLTHVYFRTRGAPASKLVTIMRDRSQIEARWEYAEGVVRLMADVARETDVEKVPGNRNACDAYRGCPHRTKCSVYTFNALDALYSKIATDHVQDRANGIQGPERLQTMGFGQQTEGAQDRLGLPRPPSEHPGVQGGQARELEAPVREGPCQSEGAHSARELGQSSQGVRLVAGSVPGATTFSGRSLPDLPSSFRRDQNQIQPPHVGTLSQHDAFPRGDVPDLQSPSGAREGQHDRVGKFNSLPERTVTVGLLASNPQLLQNQGAVTQPAPQPNVQQQLAQEEAQMRAQVAQQQRQMPQGNFNAAEFAQVCARLGQYGYGFPTLVGNAAQAYAIASGQNVPPGYTYPGMTAPPGAMRSLHALPISEPQHIYQLEAEVAAEVAKATPQQIQHQVQVQQAPMVAPAEQSFSATQPVQHTAQPSQMAQPTLQQTVLNGGPVPPPQYPSSLQQQWAPPGTAPSFLPPDAPQSMPQLAQQPPMSRADENAAAAPPFGGEPAEPAKKRGRPAKKATDSAPEAAGPSPSSPAQTAAQQAPTPPAATQVTPAAPSTYTETAPRMILVNARFADRPTKSLADYVDYINRELSKRYCVTQDGKPTLQDVRCAPKDSVLAFGGWKGAVREVVKSDPPSFDGDMHLDTFMDELNEAVADALRIVAEQKGWTYVRAVRS